MNNIINSYGVSTIVLMLNSFIVILTLILGLNVMLFKNFCITKYFSINNIKKCGISFISLSVRFTLISIVLWNLSFPYYEVAFYIIAETINLIFYLVQVNKIYKKYVIKNINEIGH